jgi:hypothetical protein
MTCHDVPDPAVLVVLASQILAVVGGVIVVDVLGCVDAPRRRPPGVQRAMEWGAGMEEAVREAPGLDWTRAVEGGQECVRGLHVGEDVQGLCELD